MKPNATNGSARFQVPTVAFFGRTMTEYLQMLALDQGTDCGLEFHLKAVEELARVTKSDLRISDMHTWKHPPRR